MPITRAITREVENGCLLLMYIICALIPRVLAEEPFTSLFLNEALGPNVASLSFSSARMDLCIKGVLNTCLPDPILVSDESSSSLHMPPPTDLGGGGGGGGSSVNSKS